MGDTTDDTAGGSAGGGGGAGDGGGAAPPPPAGGQQQGGDGAPAKARVMASELPDAVLADRLERAKRTGRSEAVSELLAKYGAKDESELADRLKAAKQLEDERANRQRAEMTELERAKADLADREAKIAERDAKIREYEEQRAAESANSAFSRIAAERINPDLLEDALDRLSRHILARAKESPDEEFTEGDVARFFRALVAKRPIFAKPAADPAAAKKKPITTGAPTVGAPPSSRAQAKGADEAGGKTILPGRPNSMNEAEARAFALGHGLKKSFGQGQRRGRA